MIHEMVGLWLDGTSRCPPTVVRGRDRIVRLALDHITQHEREPLTVASICAATGASERTIQYAFKERFQTTPKQYLLARRLSRVRRELRASPGKQVGEIAAGWGFSHLGQFALTYRATFGELPSATLSRSDRKWSGTGRWSDCTEWGFVAENTPLAVSPMTISSPTGATSSRKQGSPETGAT